jgi:xanthine dehydrogenase accessory factor
MFEILDTVENWLLDKRTVALAVVTKTWGSAPRREGSKMVVTDDLAMIGSVSGGCIEGAVIEEAQAAMQDGQPRLLKFGVADDTAWEVGLTCGGRIHVYVEPLDKVWWEAVVQATKSDSLATTITILEGALAGEKVLYDAQNQPIYCTAGLSAEQLDAFQEVARKTLQSGQMTFNEMEIMVDVFAPRPHLIIIGGVHVAIPLKDIAQTLGFRVSLIDPRRAFATKERFPDVNAIMHTYPDKSLPQLGLDKNTFLAVLTHDPKIDDKALLTALPSDVPYIGVLSSSTTHEKRTARLREAGIAQELIDRIYTPIGIDLGSKTPEEIALGIMAQIVAVRNGVLKK